MFFLQTKLSSMDWFKGKSTGNHIDIPIKYGAFL